MIIIGLDLSTKSTGVAVFCDKELLECKCLTASSTDVIKRIHKITKDLQEIIEKYPEVEKIIAEEVRPEDMNGIGNLHTQKVLMWLQAAIIFMLHDNFPKAEIEYVYPSEWRKKCGIRTGKGIKREELKLADIKFVEEKYNKVVNDDVADAIGIGHAYVNNLSNEINWA